MFQIRIAIVEGEGAQKELPRFLTLRTKAVLKPKPKRRRNALYFLSLMPTYTELAERVCLKTQLRPVGIAASDLNRLAGDAMLQTCADQ
jgi:hypothetical protein